LDAFDMAYLELPAPGKNPVQRQGTPRPFGYLMGISFWHASDPSLDEVVRKHGKPLWDKPQISMEAVEKPSQSPSAGLPPPDHWRSGIQGMADTPLTRGTMKLHGRYNWKGKPERLVYLGYNLVGISYWHQFAKVGALDTVWCEVKDDELSRFEETK
jgi:hypothetical protein